MSTDTPSGPKLTRKPVASTLLRMALPMLGGTFALNAFNLTDTWFVAQLGTLPLAAMGFSFPVVMFLVSITFGLGTGATAVVSHALGSSDHALAKRITTHALILSVCIVACVSTVGLLTIDPLFRLIGANDSVLPMIHEYMTIWYLGVVFMVVPMIANNIIRATGDTVLPSMIMILSSVLNMILDPIMIFGWMGFPSMGIRGAALATLIARAVAGVVVIWCLHHRYQLLALHVPKWHSMWQSWKEVLKIGLPSSLSSVLIPISGAVITYMVAQYGEEAVAACGAASRIEMFAFMIPMALGVTLVPFVGQNFGAKRLDRVKEAQRISYAFAVCFGILVAICFGLFARNLAQLFSDDPEVLSILTQYLTIVPIGYGMMELHRYSGFFLNAIKKPLHSTGVNVTRILVLLIPLTVAGSHYYGLSGLFWGRIACDLISGVVGMIWSHRVLNHLILHSQNDEIPVTK
ncbi:MAG: MATE family efflux transporter [Puniceicoccaceae bacterium]|nr:MATE family efflux transporter [Puniceicoccaceae bacterium]|tara:strand:+ start:7668 stop:9053 length:1386 start_codon:yes stop_codon:yes gene_type:complete